MTDLVLSKLEEAFALGCSDTEACLFADISPSVLYRYQVEHPEFQERKEQLKMNPVLKARKTVVEEIETNADLAFRLLERRSPDFKPKQETEMTATVKEIPADIKEKAVTFDEWYAKEHPKRA